MRKGERILDTQEKKNSSSDEWSAQGMARVKKRRHLFENSQYREKMSRIRISIAGKVAESGGRRIWRDCIANSVRILLAPSTSEREKEPTGRTKSDKNYLASRNVVYITKG